MTNKILIKSHSVRILKELLTLFKKYMRLKSEVNSALPITAVVGDSNPLRVRELTKM